MNPDDIIARVETSTSVWDFLSNDLLVSFIVLLSLFVSLFGLYLVSRPTPTNQKTRLAINAVVLAIYITSLVVVASVRTTVNLSRKEAYGLSVLGYGISKEDLNNLTVVNSDGSALSRVTYAIHARGQRAERVDELYSVVGLEEDGEIDIKIRESINCDGGRVLQLIGKQATPTTLRAIYEIRPVLLDGGRAKLTTPITQEWPSGTLAMTEQQMLDRGLMQEFALMRLSYPTNRFKYEVIFPPGFRVKPGSARPVSWYGIHGTFHEQEQRRLEENQDRVFREFVDNEGRLHLVVEIEYPLSSLSYGLSWVPS